MGSNGRNLDRVGWRGAFMALRHSIWHSPNVSALSTKARSLAIELHSMHNGSNNGQLFLSVRDAADRLGLSDMASTCAAFDELITVGLITCEAEAYFDIKAGTGSRARSWRLNWLGIHGERLASTCLPKMDEDLLEQIGIGGRKRLARRQRALKRYEKEKFAVVDSITFEARSAEIKREPVLESKTLNDVNGGKLPISFVRDSTTHLDHHRGKGEPDPPGWWASIQTNIDRVARLHT
jgi:hypothetical protein